MGPWDADIRAGWWPEGQPTFPLVLGTDGSGTVVDAKPACRSKELVVALSDPTHAEVTLKLEAPLTGKPETGTEVQFKGVPSAFVKDPFLLTMDVENAKIDGLKTSPCAAAPGKKSTAGRKKQ